ncbi:MAG: hypothetical protein HY064_02475 [Bacteroidetes bacterium]|nr:hypothetical protein [Bacteroidota bacterium]
MKKEILTTVLSLSATLFVSAQQIIPIVPKAPVKTAEASSLTDSSNTESNSEDKVLIYGVGGTDALDFKKFSAAGAISVGFRFRPNVFFASSVNVGTRLETKNADSVSISELYFPDVSNAAAAGSLEWDVFNSYLAYKNKTAKDPNHGLIIGFDGSLQNKSISKDSVNYKLGIFNWNAGLKYRWQYHSSKGLDANFMCGIMYNYILISDNSHSNFNSIFNDYTVPVTSKVKPFFNGFSTVFSFQINDSVFYVRTYTDSKNARDLSFDVGIKEAIKFRSF